jgi:hypothetical protein
MVGRRPPLSFSGRVHPAPLDVPERERPSGQSREDGLVRLRVAGAELVLSQHRRQLAHQDDVASTGARRIIEAAVAARERPAGEPEHD